MSTIVHLPLAAILTLFLALQARSLLVLRPPALGRRGPPDPPHQPPLTCIPVAVVLFLAARSWVAVFGLAQPEVASAITRAEREAAPRAALQR